jgi:hypothetical protein
MVAQANLVTVVGISGLVACKEWSSDVVYGVYNLFAAMAVLLQVSVARLECSRACSHDTTADGVTAAAALVGAISAGNMRTASTAAHLHWFITPNMRNNPSPSSLPPPSRVHHQGMAVLKGRKVYVRCAF